MNFLTSLSRKLGFTSGDEDDREEELEENELEDEEEEDEDADEGQSGFRFPFGSTLRNRQQYSEAYEEEEEPEYRQRKEQRTQLRQPKGANVIHDPRMDARAQVQSQFTHCERIVNVRQIEECREIIRHLLNGDSVMLNLENIDPKDCGRVVDLLSGAAFALSGRMTKVAHLSYLLAPQNVEVVEEDTYASGRVRYR